MEWKLRNISSYQDDTPLLDLYPGLKSFNYRRSVVLDTVINTVKEYGVDCIDIDEDKFYEQLLLLQDILNHPIRKYPKYKRLVVDCEEKEIAAIDNFSPYVW